MRKLSGMLPLAMFAGVALFSPAWAIVPGVDNRGVPAISKCPAQLAVPSVYHSDKIVFVITGGLVAALPADQADLDKLPRNVELDIKVQDNPTRIANLKSKVLTFLGASVNSATTNFANIRITDVEYTAVVCPKIP